MAYGAGMLMLAGTNACKDGFLAVDPMGTLSDRTVANSAGVEGLLVGAYSLLDKVGGAGSGNGISSSNWVFGSVAADDANKGAPTGDIAPITSIATFATNPAIGLFNSEWRVLYDAVQRCISLVPDWQHESVFLDAVLHHGEIEALRYVNQWLAQRPGPIITVQAYAPGARDIHLDRLLGERSISINTAAAGGNASLMTMEWK